MRINAAIALVLMALSFAGAHAWRPTAHLADTRPKIELETLFPKAFGDWVVDERVPVQLISPDTLAFLSTIYNQTLSRTYVNRNGDRIMLSVAYGGDQSDATRAHRPEVCYPAQGFQIDFNQKAELRFAELSLPVRQMVARQGGRVEPITYWITVGERTTASGTDQKLAQLAYSTRGVVPDGMLVRVSSIDAESAKAFALQDGFLRQMVEAIPATQRSIVFGRPDA